MNRKLRQLLEESIPLPQGPPVRAVHVALFALAPPFWTWWADVDGYRHRFLIAHLLTACGYIPGLIYMVYITRRDNSDGGPRQ